METRDEISQVEGMCCSKIPLLEHNQPQGAEKRGGQPVKAMGISRSHVLKRLQISSCWDQFCSLRR